MRSRISARLFVSFALLILLIVLIAIISIRYLSVISFASLELSEHHLPESLLLEDIESLLLGMVIDLTELELSGGDPCWVEAFGRKNQRIGELVDEYRVLDATHPDSLSIAVTRRFGNGHEELGDVRTRLAGLLVSGSPQGALDLARSAQEEVVGPLLADCEASLEAEITEMQEVAAFAKEKSAFARKLVLGFTALILVAGVGLSLAISISITRPLTRLVRVAESVGGGDLGARARMSGRDEISTLGQALDRMIGELGKTFAERRRFLSDASHELLTPVTVMRGHLEVLERSRDVNLAELQETTHLVLDELGRLQRLVEDLLLLTRSSGREFLHRSEFELEPFLTELLRKVSTLAERHWVLGEVPTVVVDADRDRLTQALLNLVQNAIASTGPRDRIELSAARTDRSISIRVTDSGAGIPSAEQDDIFRRFYRLDQSRSRESGGSGLGLSIVKAIIEAHGGTVTVESASGRGSRFTVFLPVEDSGERWKDRWRPARRGVPTGHGTRKGETVVRN